MASSPDLAQAWRQYAATRDISLRNQLIESHLELARTALPLCRLSDASPSRQWRASCDASLLVENVEVAPTVRLIRLEVVALCPLVPGLDDEEPLVGR